MQSLRDKAGALRGYRFDRHPLLWGANPARNRIIRRFRHSTALNPYHKDDVVIEAMTAYGDLANIKIIAALGMLIGAELDGRLDGVDVIDVPTSGNTGYGIGLLAPAWNIKRVAIYLKKDTVPLKIAVLDSFPCTEIIKVQTGLGLPSPLERAIEAAQAPRRLLLNQYADDWQLAAQYAWTARSLMAALVDEGPHEEAAGDLSAVLAMSGTRGTIWGIGAHAKELNPRTQVIQGVNAPRNEIPGSRTEADIERDVTLEGPPGMIDAVMSVTRKDAFEAMPALAAELPYPPGPTGAAGYRLACDYLARMKKKDGFRSIRNSQGVVRVAYVCADSHQLYVERETGEVNYETSVVVRT